MKDVSVIAYTSAAINQLLFFSPFFLSLMLSLSYKVVRYYLVTDKPRTAKA